jgi:hypothetical protein
MSDAGRMARGLRAVWERRARTIGRIDGLLVTLTDVPDQEQNVAFVEAPPRDPAGAIARAAELFAAHGFNVALDVERGRHPDVEEAAAKHGLRVVASRPGMVIGCDREPPPLRPGVGIRRVRDEDDWRSFISVQCEVFEMARVVVEGLCPRGDLAADDVRMYLGTLDGAVAAVSVGYLVDDTVGIFGVGTLPRECRRGLGEAVTWRTIADAAPDADLAWLQSSSEGRPLYEHMGFRIVKHWDVWSR